jgi:hypothetical protein
MEKYSFEKQNKNEQQKFAPYNESFELATKLLEKYKERIQNEQCDNEEMDEVFGEKEAIAKFVNLLPEDILKKYEGHGITRNSEIEQLAAAINIAQNKTIMGWKGKLKTSQCRSYTMGSFLILSPYNQSLNKDKSIFHKIKGNKIGKGTIIGSNQNGERLAWEANIGVIVVNTRLYPLVDELRKMFPDIKIIRANELTKHILNEVNEQDKK